MQATTCKRIAGLLASASMLVLALGATAGTSGHKNKQPNFVWLVSEDNSSHFLRLYDKQGAAMPNIEALAENGLIFENAFSNAPVCSTARTSLATGAYGPRIGTAFHRAYKKAHLPSGLKPISLYLKDAGYYTSNNVKTDFNFVQSKKNGLWSESSTSAGWSKRKPGQPFFYMQSWSATHEKSLHFPMKDLKNKATIHDPNKIQLPPIYPDTELFRYTYARNLDTHLTVDKQIGAVIDKLKQDGLLEDTFIFYFGDHGGVTPGTKGYIYERGLKVPLVIRIPENFRHLLGKDMRKLKNFRVDGFVNFVDFAPTLLKLAGVKASKQHDGKAFLGGNIQLKDLNKRDYAFAYADRFDEKYDLVRSLRRGDFKYIRHYQPMNPDGMFNAYRFKQKAYVEWRNLYEQGKLNAIQASFFEQKAPEALYDIREDPHETKNLANDPKYSKILLRLRKELQAEVKGMPDLSFYPEYWLVQHAFPQPTEFGKKHKSDIAKLIDLADLQLGDYQDVKAKLNAALVSKDTWQRYWALISLSRFDKAAMDLEPEVKALLASESNALVKARAVEFLALIGKLDPKAPIEKIIANADDNLQVLEIANIATMLHDVKGFSFNIAMKKAWEAPKKGVPNYGELRNMNRWMLDRISHLAN